MNGKVERKTYVTQILSLTKSKQKLIIIMLWSFNEHVCKGENFSKIQLVIFISQKTICCAIISRENLPVSLYSITIFEEPC